MSEYLQERKREDIERIKNRWRSKGVKDPRSWTARVIAWFAS